MNPSHLLLRLLLGRRLPKTSGTLRVSGILGRVSIRRDAWSIPHVRAETEEDAWYGLGFCQGQDRAFQLEWLLRAVHGTLSELVGSEGLPADRLSRRIGFHHAAQRQLAALDEGKRRVLDAFARGVTAGASAGCGRRAHELVLLRCPPPRFGAADVLGILKLFSFTLPSNWDVELSRLKILNEAGALALTELDPLARQPRDATPLLAGGADRLAEDLSGFLAVFGKAGGSNAWAISPRRTATGRAVLACDPHLGPFLPPAWYLAHLTTPEWQVAGASFPGCPGFPVGHNGTAAWGVTAGLVDNADLFVERIGPDGRSVLGRDGNFVACGVRTEVIQVRGGAAVREEVLETPRGPVIGPALDGELGAVSLCATWLGTGPVRGFLEVHRARGWEEFRASFADWPAMPLNLIYADTSGRIGWQLVGEAPRRSRSWGILPQPGGDAPPWQGSSVPFEEMPRRTDPEEGFLASANDPPPPGGPFLGLDWLEPYRRNRIDEALESRRDWDGEGVRRLQMDLTSLPWRELRSSVLALPAGTGEARRGLALLAGWDGRVEASSEAAAVFELFIAEMFRRVAAAKAPEAVRWVLGEGFAPLAPFSHFGVRRMGHLIALLRRQPEGWFARPWVDEMADALSTAVRSLIDGHGVAAGRWEWGRVRPLTLVHALAVRPLFARIWNLGPMACGGDTQTVAQAAVQPLAPTDNPLFIASLRMTLDVGNWDESRFVLPGGQSGNPLSPHYADLLPFWQSGGGVPIAWSATEVARTTRQSLELLPA